MTPSKRKAVRVEQNSDEPTELAVPRAPWDASSLSEEVATVHDPDGDEDEEHDAPSINPTDHFPIPNKPKGVITTGDRPPAKAATAPDDAYLEAGTVLGEYRIEAQIGEGGMGVVYAAVHPLIGKRAAVKVLKAELCRSAFNVERFVDEARIVNQIGHQNIVDVFAFGQTKDGRSYFVMEWLKGESLRARMARERLDFTEICEVVRPLARALEAAHEQGVIHRDLKPDNIFLVDLRGDAPLVKLLDFGIAKLAREEHRMERTATGAMVGTPQYIAPEQAKGYAIDFRVDIYALGGILFELLTGRPPFEADNAMEMVAKHLMEPAPRPSSVADVPPELDDLVVRMLAKQPAGRPSLAEIAAVIERTSSLDRTNVKTPLPSRRDATPPVSVPINIPTPTPVASRSLEGRRASSPVIGPSAAPSEAVPVSEMSEAIHAPRETVGKKGIALLGGGFVVAAVIAYLAVSTFSTKDREAIAEPETPTIVEPAVEPPKPAPKVEPIAVDPPKPATPQPPPPEKTVTADKTEAAVDPPPRPIKVTPRDPPKQPAKKKGRLELQITGGKGTPRVTVDGKDSAPAKELSPGVHHVVVTSAGMKPQSFSVTVEDGKTVNRRVALEAEKPAAPTKNPKDDLMAPGSLDPDKKDK